MNTPVPSATASYRITPISIPSIRMLLLRILASLLFHLPIVLSIPRHTPSLSPPPSPPPPPHHRNHHYNRSLEAIVVVAPLPPPPPPPTTTTIIEPIPFPLPPTTSFPLPPPTTTSDPWKDMCLPGQECDCSRIKDKNGEEYVFPPPFHHSFHSSHSSYPYISLHITKHHHLTINNNNKIFPMRHKPPLRPLLDQHHNNNNNNNNIIIIPPLILYPNHTHHPCNNEKPPQHRLPHAPPGDIHQFVARHRARRRRAAACVDSLCDADGDEGGAGDAFV